jgi:hypothetical protein
MRSVVCIFCFIISHLVQAQPIPDLDSAFAKQDLAELDRFIEVWRVHSAGFQSEYINRWDSLQRTDQPTPVVDSSTYSKWLHKNASPKNSRNNRQSVLSVRMFGASMLIRQLTGPYAIINKGQNGNLVITPFIPIEFAHAATSKNDKLIATEIDHPHPFLLTKDVLILDPLYDSLLCAFLEKAIDVNQPHESTASGALVHDRIAFLNKRLNVSIDTVIRRKIFLNSDLPREFDPYVKEMKRLRPYCSYPEFWKLESGPCLRKVYISTDGLSARVITSLSTSALSYYYFDDQKATWLPKAD